jgi:transcription initiation factor TFIID TATA-box-binding protein
MEVPRPPGLQIVNFVCLAELLDTQLDLTQVAERTGGKYGKRVKQAVVIRSLRPRLTGMVMANGKFLICGGRSPDESNHLAWRLCLTLQEHSLVSGPVSVSNFVVHNIVCSYNCGHKLNLALFNADHLDSSVYHPKKIRPVRHYMEDPKLVVVIFSTGKCIFTGARHQDQLHIAPSKINWAKYKLGQEYRPFSSDESVPKKQHIAPAEIKKALKEAEQEDEIEQEMLEAMLIDEILCKTPLCINERVQGKQHCAKHEAC